MTQITQAGAVSVARSQRVSTVFSRGQSLVLRPVISLSKEDELYGSLEKETRSPCCKRLQSCCFNFMHCRFKHRDLKIGDRPMYRDDIFYESNLQSLPNYTAVSELISVSLLNQFPLLYYIQLGSFFARTTPSVFICR